MPPTPPRQDPETTAQRFGRIVGEAAREAGYDIDSIRGGGRAALARKTGMEASSISRMFDGKSLPHPRYYESLAQAVGIPVRTLLVAAEIISPESLTSDSSARVTSPITPERAAEQLGISDPLDRELFLGMVARLKAREPADADSTDDGGEDGNNGTQLGGEASQG